MRELQHSGAVFDLSERYRYRLWRILEGCGGTVTFVMLNPNLADEERDDPTIRRCVGFASDWGFGRLEVVNLFAYMARQPRELILAKSPVGDFNDQYLIETMQGSELVVAAWGNYGRHLGRSKAVLEMARAKDIRLKCLHLNACGEPKHPLYLPRSSAPFDFTYNV